MSNPSNEYTLVKEQERTAISKTEHLVPDLEIAGLGTQALHHAGELDSDGLRCLRRNRVQTLTLKQVHAVQTERVDLDDGLAGSGTRLGDLVDEEGCRGAFAALDSCAELLAPRRTRVSLIFSGFNEWIPDKTSSLSNCACFDILHAM
jgi:hypothetical protein